MCLRRIALVLFALVTVPTGAIAGPIAFNYSASNLTTSPGSPALGMALIPYPAPGVGFAFDPATGVPLTVPVVVAEPTRIPTPEPIHIHPDGTTHWNNDGYFGVDVTLTDVASGEVAVLRFNGRAHMYNQYSVENGWTGETYFWFLDQTTVTLGGNRYTVWGANQYSGVTQASVNVWVGDNPPLVTAPEPGTLALAALGLTPLVFRRLRREL